MADSDGTWIDRGAKYQVAATLAAAILAKQSGVTASVAAKMFWECYFTTFPKMNGAKAWREANRKRVASMYDSL